MGGAGNRNDQLVSALVQQGAMKEGSPIERAFRTVLRNRFLPGADLAEVYSDRAVVTHRRADGVPVSSSSQPALMARMLQQLQVEPGQRVLEIGTGTGYNAALLGHLVGPQGGVTTVDVDPGICAAAERHLDVAGARNVSVVAGDGWTATLGLGMFDRIQATVGVSDLSTVWVDQLEADGVLVAPLWLRAGLQASVAFEKVDGGLQGVSTEPCGFMRLHGLGAGEPVYQKIGPWTVSFDQPDGARAAALERLLDAESRVEPAPALAPGWFTPIALRQPDAVHLFAVRPEGSLVASGLLRISPPGLAVLVSRPAGAVTLESLGDGDSRQRLLRLIQTERPIEGEGLSIHAVPAGQPAQEREALATLVRPNFSFVVRRT